MIIYHKALKYRKDRKHLKPKGPANRGGGAQDLPKEQGQEGPVGRQAGRAPQALGSGGQQEEWGEAFGCMERHRKSCLPRKKKSISFKI